MFVRALRLPVLTLFVLGFGAAAASAQTTLRYKFKAGDKLSYEIVQASTVVSKVKDQESKVNTSQTIEMTWEVLKADDKGARIKVKFGRTKMTMDGPTGEFSLDSADDKAPDEGIGKIVARVVGAISRLELTLTMSPEGEVSDVEIPEKTVKEIQDLPGADQFGEMYSSDGLKRMFGQNGLVVPKEPIAKGQGWKKKGETKLPFGTIQSNVAYVYDGAGETGGRKAEKITLTPTVSITPEPNAAFTLKLASQKGSGTAYFDNDAGRFLELNLTQTMELTVEAMDQTLVQNLVQTASVRLKK